MLLGGSGNDVLRAKEGPGYVAGDGASMTFKTGLFDGLRLVESFISTGGAEGGPSPPPLGPRSPSRRHFGPCSSGCGHFICCLGA